MIAKFKNDKTYLFFYFFILTFNPLLNSFNRGIGFRELSPDLSLYIRLSQKITQGILCVKSWEYIDIGIILPPIYPLLISFGTILLKICFPGYNEPFFIAYVISYFSSLLFLLVLYLICREFKLRYLAIIAVVIVSISQNFIYYSTRPLTEPLFLFFISIALLLHIRAFKQKSFTVGFLCGIAAGVVFLTRQIGLYLLVFFLAWQVILAMTNPIRRRYLITTALLITLGWGIVVTPFLFVLHLQTGKSYAIQRYRLNDYVIHTQNQKEIDKILSIKKSVVKNYTDIFNKRRKLYSLTNDNAAMLAYVKYDVRSYSDHTSLKTYINKCFNIINNLMKNFKNLIASIDGNLFAITICIVIIASYIYVRSNNIYLIYIPAFIFTYLIFVSFYTCHIIRYVNIMTPFIIVWFVVSLSEIKKYRSRYFQNINVKKMRFLLAPIFSIVILYSNAMKHIPVQPWYIIADNRLSNFSKYIEHTDSVFAFRPQYAVAIDANYRIIPNATIYRIGEYAKYTNVRWLLLNKHELLGDVRLKYYHNADWLYGQNTLGNDYPNILKLKASNTEYLLYEFL